MWAQILSRDQTRTVVLRIPCHHFTARDETRLNRRHGDQVEVLWEEHTDAWINVSDAYYFFKNPPAHCTQFIWSSERTGFRHLYLVTKPRHGEPQITPITSGEWCVSEHPLVHVDEDKRLVYFQGKRDTPLEMHLYVTSFAQNADHEIRRLTELGYSHQITMDPEKMVFVDCFSSLHQPQCIALRRLSHDDHGLLPVVEDEQTQFIVPVSTTTTVENNDNDDENQEIFGCSPQTMATNLPQMSPSEADMLFSADSLSSKLPLGEIFSFVNSEGKYIYLCNIPRGNWD